MGAIRIEIDKVFCEKTEDRLGGDDFYYASTLRPDEPKDLDSFETPLPNQQDFYRESSRILVEKGDTKALRRKDRVLFEGLLDKEKAVIGSLYFFDDDQGSIDEDIFDKVAFVVLLLISGGLGFLLMKLSGFDTSVFNWIAGLIIICLPTFFLGWVAAQTFYKRVMQRPNFDKDDLLGAEWFNFPAIGPEEEFYTMELKGVDKPMDSESGKKFSGSWNCSYLVTLRIRRKYL